MELVFRRRSDGHTRSSEASPLGHRHKAVWNHAIRSQTSSTLTLKRRGQNANAPCPRMQLYVDCFAFDAGEAVEESFGYCWVGVDGEHHLFDRCFELDGGHRL